MNGSKPVRVLVPRKAVSEIARLMEGSESVAFSQTANHLVFTAAGRMLACKMIEGQFPAWEKVLKAAGTKTVDLKTAQLAATMRRVSLLASERVARPSSRSSRACWRCRPRLPTWAAPTRR